MLTLMYFFQGSNGFFEISAGSRGKIAARLGPKCFSSMDKVIIPGGSKDGTGSTASRYCGGLLGHTKYQRTASPVKCRFLPPQKAKVLQSASLKFSAIV